LASTLEAADVGFSTRVTILGQIQRGRSPTSFDHMLAARLGVKAVEALITGESDKMVGLQGREIELIPLEEFTARTRPANLGYYHMARVLAR
jgi:6-phosphofructokinase 1